MKAFNIYNLRIRAVNIRTLWGNFLLALLLFLIVLFVLGVPQNIQRGIDGQAAIKELDGMNHPLLKMKAVTSNLHNDQDIIGARSELIKLGKSAESCIQNFEAAASYSEVLSQNVADFTLAYKQWLDAENEYLTLFAGNHDSTYGHFSDHYLTLKASENNALFLNALHSLADGEPTIHDDLERARHASIILQWALALLVIYLFTVIVLYQRKSNRIHAVREANLEVTLRSIGDAVIATDILGNVTCMSPEAERLTGWDFEQAKGESLSDVFRVVNEHSGQPVDDLVKQVKDQNNIVVLAEDSMLLASDGRCYQIYENGAPIYGDSGSVVGVLLVFRDITNSRRLKSRLKEKAKRLQRVIDSSMDAVIVMDKQGMVEEWNPAAEAMFGWSYEDICKQPIHETIIPEQYRDRHLQGVEHLIRSNPQHLHTKRIESSALHRDGHEFPIELAMTSINTENGWMFNAFIRDLTEQKNNEKIIKKHSALLQEAQKVAKLGYWDYDIANQTLEWSEEIYSIFALDSVTTTPSYEIFLNSVHPEDRERVNASYTESVQNKTPYFINYRIETKEGVKTLMSQCVTTYDEDGNPLRSLGVSQDVTKFIEKEKTLRKQEELLRETQRIAKLGYWELDLVKGKLEWSDEIFRIFCLDPAVNEPSYGLFMNAIHPDDRERVDAAYSESLKNKKPYNIIHRITSSKGIRIVHEQCKTKFGDDGKPLRSLGTVQDITERVNDMDELRLAATMFKTHAGILITDKNGIIVRVNPAFEKMTGYSSDELLGKNPRILQSGTHDEGFYKDMWSKIKETGIWQGELWNKRKDGELYVEWLTITEVMDENNEVINYVGTSQDITERKHAESQVEYLAYHDELTGLANRRLLNDRLQQNIVTCKRNDEFGAVMMLDLDRFKDLNDSLGHSVGDDVLKKVAARLKTIVREGDTVARMGSDEFVIVLSSVGKRLSKIGTDVQAIAENIRKSLSQPYQLEEGQCFSGASIGITLFPEMSEDIEDILKHADTALYRAKAQGRNSVCFYQPSMQAEVDERLVICDGLRHAIENNEFTLHYQPQVSDRGELIGAEALLRWQHPEHGIIEPDKFISVAEDTGLILEIGQWVLREAARQVAEWHSAGICKNLNLRMSVNVSPRQFGQKDFVTKMLAVMEDVGISPACIELEVTESMLMHDLDEGVVKMQQLRAHGVRISIDDFGTGYSSLAYLKKLPLDQLKIDQSFIREITSDENNAVVVDTIIAMAHHLGLSVIAEGVEDRAQLDFLIDKGCRAFQGYYFFRPLNAEDFANYIMEKNESYLLNQA